MSSHAQLDVTCDDQARPGHKFSDLAHISQHAVAPKARDGDQAPDLKTGVPAMVPWV